MFGSITDAQREHERLLGRAWDSAEIHWTLFKQAVENGDHIDADIELTNLTFDYEAVGFDADTIKEIEIIGDAIVASVKWFGHGKRTRWLMAAFENAVEYAQG